MQCFNIVSQDNITFGSWPDLFSLTLPVFTDYKHNHWSLLNSLSNSKFKSPCYSNGKYRSKCYMSHLCSYKYPYQLGNNPIYSLVVVVVVARACCTVEFRLTF